MLHQKIHRLSQRISLFETKLEKTLNTRLVCGLAAVGLFVAAAVFREQTWLQPLAFLVAPGVFYFFARTSRNLRRHLSDLNSLKSFFERQSFRQQGLHNPDFLEPSLPPETNLDLANDIDLFHGHSLFELVDETFTRPGQKRLIHKITHRLESADEIRAQQEHVSELSKRHWSLTRLVLAGRGSKESEQHINLLEDFVDRPFLEGPFYRDLKILWGLTALTIFGIFQHFKYGWFSPAIFPTLHLIYFIVASGAIKTSLTRANDLATHLGHLMPIFGLIERPGFLGSFEERLRGIKKFRPSEQMKSLNWIISGLSVQAHPLVYIGLNTVIPWSFTFAALLEKNRNKMKEGLPDCLDELAELEVSASLAILYKYQSQTLPRVSDLPTLEFTDLYHPLIDRKTVVANSFSQTLSTSLNLITGSNMAGKSTFLRTVGINQVLFQMGAPVFAKSYVSHPFLLTSSIRVSDSLESGFSYFYAEVLRLKSIIENSAGDRPVLYLIDEIFRGTNNRERLIGSQAILRALAKTEGIGFVSTHDLELTKLAEEGSKIENFHFRDDVEGEKLVFTYKMHSGPCPTTNALRIMHQAGLPVPPPEK